MKKILIFIIILASVLRIYDLAANRAHLTNDEAAIGYNAYSILTTARDEHGEFMPIFFKSFGDWKPGLYIYTVVPFIKILGLNEFSVRLPSAIVGIIAVVVVYLIIRRLFKQENLALFSAFFLAISPWHINFSRGAWEANLALTLLLTAIYFLLISFKTNKYIIISSIFFALTLWAYQSAKLASLIPLVLLLVIYKNKFFAISKKYLLVAVLFGLAISVPVLQSVYSEKSGRLEVMSVFSYERSQEYIEETVLSQEDAKQDSLVYMLYHSEPLNFYRGVAGRYFNHFSGKFLFFMGDWQNTKHTSPNMGYLLLLDAPLFVFGLYYLFRERSPESIFILLWLALSPLASAITRDSIHGVRSLNMVIPLVITVGSGATHLLSMLKKAKPVFGIPVLLIFIILYIFNFAYYLDAYYVHGKIADARDFMYGYKQIVEKVVPVQDKYKKIVFVQSYDQPYIYFLFYGSQMGKDIYKPSNFQNNTSFVDNIGGDVGQLSELGNIEFRDINWNYDKTQEDTLLIAREHNFPLEETDVSSDYIIDRVYYPNGLTAFVMVEVNREP